jgi:hypothetical protein
MVQEDVQKGKSNPALQLVLPRLKDVRRSGSNQWEARCPAHDDRRPSLSISTGDEGKVLLHCQSAGCSFEEIVAALRLTKGTKTMQDLNELTRKAVEDVAREEQQRPNPAATAKQEIAAVLRLLKGSTPLPIMDGQQVDHETALRALVLVTLGKRLESTSGTFPIQLGELIRGMMGNVSDVSTLAWGHAVGRLLAIPGKLLKPWLEGQETGTGDRPNPLVS